MSPFPQSRRGFTLIELLAAMTILTIMVLLISRLFADSTRLWKVGTKRIESNTDGRAVVDFMVREISAALCDGVNGPLGLKLDSDSHNAFGMRPDTLYFCTSAQTAERRGTTSSPKDYRQVSQVIYSLMKMEAADNSDYTDDRYRIVRAGMERLGGSYTCYDSGGFPQGSYSIAGLNPQTLAENIRTLEFWVYDTNGVSIADFDSSIHGRPAYVEVYLEMLGQDDAIKASLMSGSVQADYCNRMARRYVGRAYLHANGGRE